MTNAAYGNGTSTSYTGYDQYNQVTQLNENLVNTSGLTINYGRDNNERRTQDSFSDSTYVWHPPAAGSVPYVPNTLNQYSSINNQTLIYGANGTLGSDASAPLGAATYGWDMFNRMISATNSQHTASYSYDTVGRRNAKTVDGVGKNYAWDSDRIILQYGQTALPASSSLHGIYGVGNAPFLQEQFSGGSVYNNFYLLSDALDTTMVLSGDVGKVNSAYQTSPWGEVNTTAGTPFRFAGMFLDAETMLYYDHARYYSPAQGRFISPDPSGLAGGMNIYAYAGNDPVNSVDLNGLDITGKLCTTDDCGSSSSSGGDSSGGGGGGISGTLNTTYDAYTNVQVGDSYFVPDGSAQGFDTASSKDGNGGGTIVWSGSLDSANGIGFDSQGTLFGGFSTTVGGVEQVTVEPSGFNANLYEVASNDPVGPPTVTWKPNYPHTIPVTGAAATALACMPGCLGKSIYATGGQEQTGHSPNSAHYNNQAVDMRLPAGTTLDETLQCALSCGFQAGWFANWGNAHVHVQLTPGNGVPAIAPR